MRNAQLAYIVPVENPNGRPDNSLPSAPGFPDNSLPGNQPGIDNSLPGQPARPDNTLPGQQVFWMLCYTPHFGWKYVTVDPKLRPDQGLPGSQPHPDQGLPETAEPKG